MILYLKSFPGEQAYQYYQNKKIKSKTKTNSSNKYSDKYYYQFIFKFFLVRLISNPSIHYIPF